MLWGEDDITETVKMHRNRISRNMGEIEIVIPCETFLVKVPLEEAMLLSPSDS